MKEILINGVRGFITILNEYEMQFPSPFIRPFDVPYITLTIIKVN